MTQKEEKEYIKLLPRFKEICCSRMCKYWDKCKETKDDESFMTCPWFSNFVYTGWPVQRLTYLSCNAPKLPDLRKEDISDEKIKELLEN